MIINGITGYSASMRKSSKTLSGFMDDVLAAMPDVPKNINKQIISSLSDKCVEDSLRFLYAFPDTRILLVGKSMGAVKTWWLLTKYWTNVLQRISVRGARLGVVLIDPHGWCDGDGRVGSYGVRLKNLGFEDGWARDNMRIACLRQRNKYPKGAGLAVPRGVTNAKNVKLKGDADHWKVTNINTDAGRRVSFEIQSTIRWLMEDL